MMADMKKVCIEALDRNIKSGFIMVGDAYRIVYARDIINLIESLAAELEQVKQERDGLDIMLGQARSMLETRTRERDAAIEDMKGICGLCAHEKTCTGYWCGDCDEFDVCEAPCKNCDSMENWQWRGHKEE